MIIRYAKESDYRDIWDIMKDDDLRNITLSKKRTFSEFKKDEAKRLKEGRKRLVAYEGKEFLGYCIFVSKETYSKHVTYIGITIKEGKQRQKIGTALFKEAVKRTKKIGIKKIIWGCLEYNKASKAFAKAHGFKYIGKQKKQCLINRKYYDYLLYEKFI